MSPLEKNVAKKSHYGKIIQKQVLKIVKKRNKCLKIRGKWIFIVARNLKNVPYLKPFNRRGDLCGILILCWE
jgi:hypothetical protein